MMFNISKSSIKKQSTSCPNQKISQLWFFVYLEHLNSFITFDECDRCRGTVALVHAECLERWLTESGHSRCELCGYKYATKRVPRYNLFRSVAIWFNTVIVTRQVRDLAYSLFSYSFIPTTRYRILRYPPWFFSILLVFCNIHCPFIHRHTTVFLHWNLIIIYNFMRNKIYIFVKYFLSYLLSVEEIHYIRMSTILLNLFFF